MLQLIGDENFIEHKHIQLFRRTHTPAAIMKFKSSAVFTFYARS
jgi:hypothetical protein